MLKIFVAQVIVLKIRIFYHEYFKGDTVQSIFLHC